MDMEGVGRVLAFNGGSSGLKWSLLAAADGSLVEGGVEPWTGDDPAASAGPSPEPSRGGCCRSTPSVTGSCTAASTW